MARTTAQSPTHSAPPSKRASRYGQQFSEFKSEHLVGIIGEMIAKFEDGSGNATEAEIRSRIKAAFPVSSKIHKSRQ